ncbi:MAG: aminodeoxychorismate synthase component [Noviherbaspirillum sp.]|nr:aminodeoxychorismate synthase component [Noviherbaspirillum sp.]
MPAAPDTFNDCFALLDDSSSGVADPRSRLYTGYVGSLECCDAADLPELWQRLQQALSEGRHAVGLFSYELGAQMQGIEARPGEAVVSRVLLFERCEKLSSAQVDDWLATRATGQRAGIANLRASVDERQFRDAVASIHAYIEAGDAYQVNYTYRLTFDAYGAPLQLYRQLRARQPVPYGALISMPDGSAVLSLSPELFVRHRHGQLTARPMKGTAAATGDAAEDALRAVKLAGDPKNRAENLMIVDLLRNDLGRIAMPGSVQVPRLFDVDRYRSVLQMTSTVTAVAREETTLEQAFSALFPCGSVTGAPKRRSMQIIRELESGPRGFYTGAIGWFDAPDPGCRVADFCLSVPIRTAVLSALRGDGVRHGVLGIGAGIVHDSVANDEYAECRLKGRFLSELPCGFELFETMHATQADGCRHLEFHLARLRRSAEYFGFAFSEQQARDMLERARATLAPGAHRVRLALKQSGECSVQCAPLSELSGPVKVLLAARPAAVGEVLLRHKTTVREDYDAAWQAAEAQGAFDMLFCNKRGELTEGARSNVFLKLHGRWYTPPLDAGLLPGIMRTVLLADPTWDARERRLTLDDLRAAEQVVVCNALRGALVASVVPG